MSIITRNLFCAYPGLLRMLSNRGVDASPRGKQVLEMQGPTMWVLNNPQEWAIMIPGRKLNPFFALAEVIWMWSGKGGSDFIQFYNKSITQFLDPGIPYFHGSYGKRVRHAGYSETPFRSIPTLQSHTSSPSEGTKEVEIDQLEWVISKLRTDPETRQAVVSLWDPCKDNFVESKDHPCNNTLYFWVRDNELNMTVVRRSNDLVWGVPYNMIQFSHLHALMAGSLGVAVGTYYVIANNLHYYKELYPDTLKTVLGWAENVNLKQMDLDAASDLFYDKPWDMRWDIHEFDSFVRLEWDPFEKQSRNYIEFHVPVTVEPGVTTVSAFYNTRIMHMESAFAEHKVPRYWRSVFLTLMAYHCRKAKCPDMFNSLISQLPRPIQWLIADFISKEAACSL